MKSVAHTITAVHFRACRRVPVLRDSSGVIHARDGKTMISYAILDDGSSSPLDVAGLRGALIVVVVHGLESRTSPRPSPSPEKHPPVTCFTRRLLGRQLGHIASTRGRTGTFLSWVLSRVRVKGRSEENLVHGTPTPCGLFWSWIFSSTSRRRR